MERYSPAVKSTLFVVMGAIIMFAAFATCCRGATPTPTPDLSNVTEADIAATIAHRNALHEQLIQETLPQASDDVRVAVEEAQVLQTGIDKLALSAARVPVLESELAKAHKACWRNLLLGGIVGAILALFGPKLLGLASLLGA